jgi:hypothetical protein
MAKTPEEYLLEEIADDFHTYLRKGVRFDRVIGSAHPDLDIDDMETLLRIHFVLTNSQDSPEQVGVLDFMKKLEERIRRMKTTTTRESIKLRGEVRGHIDWHQTAKTRAREGDPEAPIFVCNLPEENYDIDENLVLKRLLSIIHDIVFSDLKQAIENPDAYGWVDLWTEDESEETAVENEPAVDLLQRIFERNIYLQRIDVDGKDITDRTIEDVKRSRSPFYHEAAVLLDRYRQLMNQQLQSEEACEILNNTIIAPEKTEVLFELYWIFRLLNAFEDIKYRVLTDWGESQSTIATWTQDGSRFKLSHDSTGEGLTFDERIESESVEPDGYLYRMNAVLNEWQLLSQKFLGSDRRDSLWGGRPDIVLEQFSLNEEDGQRLEQVFVGEVKYSRDIDYIATGLRELLEYMAFVRRDSDGWYVEEPNEVLESVSVRGLLFVDSLDHEIPSLGDIDIIEYDDPVNRIL